MTMQSISGATGSVTRAWCRSEITGTSSPTSFASSGARTLAQFMTVLCLHIPLVGLHAGDPSAQGTESRDLRIGGKFHAHAPCTPGVGLRAVKRIRVPVLLTEGGSEHALRVKIRNDLLRLFQGNGAGIDAQTVLHL